MARTGLVAALVLAVAGLAAACGSSSPGGASLERSPTAGPLIRIDTPASGERVLPPLHVAGTASVFEGALQVAVKDAAGDELCRVPVQASAGGPDEGTWETTIPFVPPAAGQGGSVVAFSESAKDGSAQNEVSVPVTLAADYTDLYVTAPRCGDTVGTEFAVEGFKKGEGDVAGFIVYDADGRTVGTAQDVTLSGGFDLSGDTTTTAVVSLHATMSRSADATGLGWLVVLEVPTPTSASPPAAGSEVLRVPIVFGP